MRSDTDSANNSKIGGGVNGHFDIADDLGDAATLHAKLAVVEERENFIGLGAGGDGENVNNRNLVEVDRAGVGEVVGGDGVGGSVSHEYKVEIEN